MGTSVPRRNEQGSPPGEVKVMSWTPEQIAEHLGNSEQKNRNKDKYMIVDDGGRTKKPKVVPDMANYLQMRADGQSRAEIAVEWGISENTLRNYHCRRWGLTTNAKEAEAIKKHMKVINPETHAPDQPEATPSKQNIEKEPARMTNTNIEWFKPERKVEGPALTFYKEGAGINKTAQQLMGIETGQTVHFGYNEAEQQIMLKVAPGGIKTTQASRSNGMKLNNKALTEWVKGKKIKIQKYPLHATERADIFVALIESE